MKAFIFSILLVFAMGNSLIAQDLYHRVKVYTTNTGLQQMAQKGIAVDHGEIKKGHYFISDLSDSEIEIIQSLNLHYEIQIVDVTQYYIDRNNKELQLKSFNSEGCVDCPDYNTPDNFELGSMGGFYTYAELLKTLDSMKVRFPNLISNKQPIGTYTTHNGNQVLYVKISDNPDTDEADEEQVLYTALHHAREAQSLSQLVFYMWYILENYGIDEEITYLVDNREMYFIPCINPDGYIFNQTTNPSGGGMWRKNRRVNGGSFGVDLNRNYGSHWGYDDAGSSPNAFSDVYRGPSAFSENETKAIRDFCIAHNFKIALNAHTYSNLLIYPYGYVEGLRTPDSITYRNLAEEMVSCSGFHHGTGDETVGYVTNGDSDDWMYEEQIVKNKIFAMTPEAGSSSDGFWPATSRIIPISKNTLLQNLYVARLAGPYAEVRKAAIPAITSLNTQIPFEFRRTGIDESGSYTVSILPISANINTTGSPKIYSHLALNTIQKDSIAIHLHPSTVYNEEVKYVLQWTHSSGMSINDTVVALYAGLDTLYYNDCSDISTFTTTGDWGINTSQFTSAGGSISESPTGNYLPNTLSTISTRDWIDLTDVSFAILQFNAKWSIEDRYDYLEIYAEIEGGGSTALCGLYSTKGSENQQDASAIYDGRQYEWIQECINLNDFKGEKIKIRFEFSSDMYEEMDGFYADDITILVDQHPNTTGIVPDNSLSSGIVVFPNPAKDKVSIQYKANEFKEATFIVSDVTGKIINSTSLNPNINNIELNIQNWPNGIYLYAILTEKGMSPTRKLAIQR